MCRNLIAASFSGVLVFTFGLIFTIVWFTWAAKEVSGTHKQPDVPVQKLAKIRMLTSSAFFPGAVSHYKQASCYVFDKQMELRWCNQTRCGRPAFYVHLNASSGLQLTTVIYDSVTGSFSTSLNTEYRYLDRFQVGSTYTCWYNPSDPYTAVFYHHVPLAPVVVSIVFGSLLGLALLASLVVACSYACCNRYGECRLTSSWSAWRARSYETVPLARPAAAASRPAFRYAGPSSSVNDDARSIADIPDVDVPPSPVAVRSEVLAAAPPAYDDAVKLA